MKIQGTTLWGKSNANGLLGLAGDFIARISSLGVYNECWILSLISKKFQMAVNRKRSGKLSKKVVLLHDNMHPHMAKVSENILKLFTGDIFGQLPDSPDLVP